MADEDSAPLECRGTYVFDHLTMEAWLSGPLDGIDVVLMPAAHALVQAREDIALSVATLTAQQIALRPGDIASVGFHLRHIAGSIDRLLTYARGEMLNDRQRQWLAAEVSGADVPAGAKELVACAHSAIDEALRVMRATDVTTLQERRTVGRAALPTTVFGLLFHVAEHTQRHTGQIITTAKIVKAGSSGVDLRAGVKQAFPVPGQKTLANRAET